MKRIEKYLFTLLSLCCFVILFSIYLVPNVSAQEQSLSIYPPVIEIQATPPSSPTVPILIQNNNSENVKLQIQLVPFRTDNRTGQITLVPDEAEKGFYPYYKERIQFLIDGRKTSTVELLALEQREILLNVNLTKGDPPGDFYFSIVMISENELSNESSTSQIPTGIATNLLLSIGPKSTSTGGISEFSTSSFKSKGPVSIKLKLHNASRHVIQPTGVVTITNMLGQNIGSLKILPQYVLAGSDRYLVDEAQGSPTAQIASNLLSDTPSLIWGESFLLGWYKATATVGLEENGKPILATTYFFAFPTYAFFGLVILLFILISIYVRVKRKI